MRVWTNGKTHLVVGPRGLSVYAPKKEPRLTSITGAPVATGPLKTKWYPLDLLAAPPSARLAIAGVGTEAHSIALEGKSADKATPPTKVPWKILDLAAIDEERVIAAVAGGTDKKPKARVVIGAIPAEGGKWEREIEVPAPTKVAWPDTLIWAEGATPPWSKRPAMGTSAHDIVVAHNAFGSVVADKSTGIVALVRPGASACEAALRVPTQDEARLFGAATKEGMLVVLTIEGRDSAVCHFGADGKLIAHKSKFADDVAWGVGPPCVVDAKGAWLVNTLNDPQLFSVSLPLLEDETVLVDDLGSEVDGELSMHMSPDGKVCVIGLGTHAWLARATGDGCDADELPDVTAGGASGGGIATKLPAMPASKLAALASALSEGRPAAQPGLHLVGGPAPKLGSLSPGRDRIKGPPSLAQVPKKDAPRVWSANVGGTLSIEMVFTSMGGPSNGIYVELSGTLISDGLVRARSAKVGAAEAVFTAVDKGVARVELPKVELPAGFVPLPKGVPAIETEPHIAALLSLEATAAGAGLLSVRIGPLAGKPKGAGSLAQSKRTEIGTPTST